MAILNVVTSEVGLVGVSPSFIYITTNNTQAEVLATGFLNTLVQNGYGLQSSMVPVVTTVDPATGRPEAAVYDLLHAGNDWSLSLQTATVEDDSITVAKLETQLKPAAVVKAAAQVTTTGGNATENFAIAGLLATDIVQVTLADVGTNTVSIVSQVVSAGQLAVTFSADPGNDAKIVYTVYRAVV